MVSTRRQGGKAETLGFETVVEKVEHIETASTRPKKRRRHIKAPDDPIDFIKREGQKVDQAKDRQATVTAKLSKKAKKLLETMHTDDSLPLVRQKAARVSMLSSTFDILPEDQSTSCTDISSGSALFRQRLE